MTALADDITDQCSTQSISGAIDQVYLSVCRSPTVIRGNTCQGINQACWLLHWSDYWLLIRHTGRHTGGDEPTLWLKLEAYKTNVSIDQVCYLGKLNSKDLLVFQVHEEAVHQQLVVDVSCSCSNKFITELLKLERRRVQNCDNLCIPFHILESLSISWSTSEELPPWGPFCRPTWHRILRRPSRMFNTERPWYKDLHRIIDLV